MSTEQKPFEEPPRRRRGADCLSDLVLDALERTELVPGEADAARRHLASCEACAGRAAGLRQEALDFASAHNIAQLAADTLGQFQSRPAPTFMQRLASSALRVWGVPAAVSVGVVIIAVKSFLAPMPDKLVGGFESTHSKGSFNVGLYVKHADRPGEPTVFMGEPLHPADRVRFTYNGSKPGYLAIVAVDSDRKVSVYYPSSGPQAARVDPGEEVNLASAVELDATLGPETIIAVRCDLPIAVDEVVTSARAAMTQAIHRGAPPTDLGQLGLACAESRVEIRKAAVTPPAR